MKKTIMLLCTMIFTAAFVFQGFASDTEQNAEIKMRNGYPVVTIESDIHYNGSYRSDVKQLGKTHPDEEYQNGILFYGDSNFRLWKNFDEDFAEYDAINHGFGGSTAVDLVYYANTALFPYQPAIAVIQNGLNDYELLTGTDEERAEECITYRKQMFEAFHEIMPDTRFLIVSTLLVPGRDEYLELAKLINDRTEELTEEYDYLYYVDSSALTYDGSGFYEELFIEDGLHLTDEGRVKWAEEYIKPALEAIITENGLESVKSNTISERAARLEEASRPKFRSEELHVMNGDIDLYGEMYLPVEEKDLYPAVILTHGLGSNANGMAGQAKLLAENGFAAYVFDINEGSTVSRSGKADGDMSHLSPLTAAGDLNAVVDFIKELPYVDDNHLFLSGASFGGLTSAYVAAMRPELFKALALQSPAFILTEEFRETYSSPDEIPETFVWGGIELGKKFAEDAMTVDIYSLIGNYKGDVLLCHGDADETVDVSYAYKAADVYENETLVIFEGAGHAFAGKDKPVFEEKYVAFLKEHLAE